MNSKNIYTNVNNNSKIVNILVNYFRNLTNKHIELKTFTSGLPYDIEEIEGNVYPLLQFVYPIISVNTFSNGNDLLTVSFDLAVYNGGYLDENNIEHNIAPELVNEVRIQNELGDLVILDEIEDRAFRILNQIITKLSFDLRTHRALPTFEDVKKYALKGAYLSNDVQITTERLTTSSLLSAAKCTVSITFNNPFFCELESVFSNCN